VLAEYVSGCTVSEADLFIAHIWWFVRWWSVVVGCLSLSLAQAGRVLVVRHGVPRIGCGVALPVICCAGTEYVRGNVDHDGLAGVPVTVTVKVAVKVEGGAEEERLSGLEAEGAAEAEVGRTQGRRQMAGPNKQTRARSRAVATECNGKSERRRGWVRRVKSEG